MTVEDIDLRTTVLTARVEAFETRFQTIESNQQLILQKLSFVEQFITPQQWYPYGPGQQQPCTPITSTLQPFSAPFTPTSLCSQPPPTNMPSGPVTPTTLCSQPLSSNIPSTPTTPTNSMQQVSSTPTRKPLPIKAASNALSSSEIKKTKLMPVADVLLKYPKLKGDSKAGTLAVKLAREALFGDDILIQCTTFGNREHPALPVAELNQLKHELFQLFPQYWPNPVEFESLWRTCGEAVGQVCKRLRSHKPPPVSL